MSEFSEDQKERQTNGAKRTPPKARWKDIVGSSAFVESRNLAPKVGVERLFLKFEGGNPTGTQKDRIALALAEDAWKKEARAIVTATCGNYGAALAYAAKLWQIPAHIFIPKGYHLPKDRLKRIQDAGAELHFEEGQYEDLVYLSGEISEKNGWYNANPGADGTTEIALNAYAEIATEAYREMRRVPDYVFCPVGNGTTIAGIYQGYKNLVASGKVMRVPRMIATSTRRGNAIVKSFKLRSRKVIDLSREEIKETKINEPLTNWHSFDGQEALDAIYESDGFADYASEAKMIEYAKLAREEEGLNVLPAAASALAVMAQLADSRVIVKGHFLAILTGRDF